MSASFYPKLAAENIRKNSRTYIPYILICIFTVAMYYIMKSLSLNEGLNGVMGAGTLAYTLELGSNIIAIFAFIFLFYTNSFLTKNRKKEFGLFNILGMEKKHIAKLIAYETVYVTIISLCGGIGVGVLLDKLMYVAVSRLIRINISLGFYVSSKAIESTIVLFAVLFLIIFINSLRLIHLTSPVELLKGGNVGEKEPKAKWLIAILGISCLCTGYYIAVTVKNPLMALSLFFVAVLLVIFGTYLVFTSGSIALLKMLKKNKRYYYKTNHFISISGMIYRMKQNAVGLANICVLSTMVLVMVSSTASLIIGIEDILIQRYPYQIEFSLYDVDSDKFNGIISIVEDMAENEDVKIKEHKAYSSLQFSAVYNGEDTFIVSSDQDMSQIDGLCNLNFMTADDYEIYTGEKVVLEQGEVILYCYGISYDKSYFNLFGEKYNIIAHTDKYTGGLMSPELCPTFGIIVSDMSIMQNLRENQFEVYGKNSSSIMSYLLLDIDGNADLQIDFYKKAGEKLKSYAVENELKYSFGCREDSRDGLYELYGGLFFLGIFLGLLFTMAAVLIIYYKQISEGMEDKKRFEIMQKVGMSEQEVKGSIHSQVLTVFFMPLIMAGIHTAFAFPIIRKILAMMQLTNVRLFALCTIGSFLAFALIYIVIYLLTAKVYYKIIRR